MNEGRDKHKQQRDERKERVACRDPRVFADGKNADRGGQYYAKQTEKERKMNWKKQTAAAQKSNNKTNNSLTVPRVQAMQREGSRG